MASTAGWVADNPLAGPAASGKVMPMAAHERKQAAIAGSRRIDLFPAGPINEINELEPAFKPHCVLFVALISSFILAAGSNIPCDLLFQ